MLGLAASVSVTVAFRSARSPPETVTSYWEDESFTGVTVSGSSVPATSKSARVHVLHVLAERHPPGQAVGVGRRRRRGLAFDRGNRRALGGVVAHFEPGEALGEVAAPVADPTCRHGVGRVVGERHDLVVPDRPVESQFHLPSLDLDRARPHGLDVAPHPRLAQHREIDRPLAPRPGPVRSPGGPRHRSASALRRSRPRSPASAVRPQHRHELRRWRSRQCRPCR